MFHDCKELFGIESKMFVHSRGRFISERFMDRIGELAYPPIEQNTLSFYPPEIEQKC